MLYEFPVCVYLFFLTEVLKYRYVCWTRGFSRVFEALECNWNIMNRFYSPLEWKLLGYKESRGRETTTEIFHSRSRTVWASEPPERRQ